MLFIDLSRWQKRSRCRKRSRYNKCQNSLIRCWKLWSQCWNWKQSRYKNPVAPPVCWSGLCEEKGIKERLKVEDFAHNIDNDFKYNMMHGIIKLSFNKVMSEWNNDLVIINCFRKRRNLISKLVAKLEQILEVGSISVTIVERTHWIVPGYRVV